MLQFNTGKKLEKVFPPDQFDALIDYFQDYGSMAATKADVRESELRLQLEIEKVRGEVKETEARLKIEIEKVRAETEKVRGEVKETEARLKVEIEKVRTETEKIRAEIHQSKLDTLKWMVGCFIALAAIMAKGFGWIGF